MKSSNTRKQRAKVNVTDIISRVVNMLKIEYSLASLEDALALLTEVGPEERDNRVNKLLAEVNFLIAVGYKKMNKRQEMLKHAHESIDLYRTINILKLEDSVPILQHLLPDYLHEGVVESKLLKED